MSTIDSAPKTKKSRQLTYAGLVGLLNASTSTPRAAEVHKKARRLSDNPNAQLLAARLSIDLARRSHKINRIDAHLEQAEEELQQVLALSKPGNPHRLHLRVQARTLAAFLPAYAGLFLLGELPTKEEQETAYGDLLQVTEETHAATRKKYILASMTADEHIDFAGAKNELALTLLTHRLSGKIGPEEWSPFPSLISDDLSRVHNTMYNGYDLGIYTNYGEGLDLTYRVQAKRNRTRQVYVPGISVVVTKEHLRVEPVRSPDNQILLYALQEAAGDQEATKMLDIYEVALADRIDVCN